MGTPRRSNGFLCTSYTACLTPLYVERRLACGWFGRQGIYMRTVAKTCLSAALILTACGSDPDPNAGVMPGGMGPVITPPPAMQVPSGTAGQAAPMVPQQMQPTPPPASTGNT